MSKSFLQPSRACALSFGVWICRWLLRSDDLLFPASLQWQFQEFASDPIISLTGFLWSLPLLFLLTSLYPSGQLSHPSTPPSRISWLEVRVLCLGGVARVVSDVNSHSRHENIAGTCPWLKCTPWHRGLSGIGGRKACLRVLRVGIARANPHLADCSHWTGFPALVFHRDGLASLLANLCDLPRQCLNRRLVVAPERDFVVPKLIDEPRCSLCNPGELRSFSWKQHRPRHLLSPFTDDQHRSHFFFRFFFSRNSQSIDTWCTPSKSIILRVRYPVRRVHTTSQHAELAP